MSKPKRDEMKLQMARFVYEVLMPVGEIIHGSLGEIEKECDTGDWSGRFYDNKTKVIKGRRACKRACEAQGTDLEFFFPEAP